MGWHLVLRSAVPFTADWPVLSGELTRYFGPRCTPAVLLPPLATANLAEERTGAKRHRTAGGATRSRPRTAGVLVQHVGKILTHRVLLQPVTIFLPPASTPDAQSMWLLKIFCSERGR